MHILIAYVSLSSNNRATGRLDMVLFSAIQCYYAAILLLLGGLTSYAFAYVRVCPRHLRLTHGH